MRFSDYQKQAADTAIYPGRYLERGLTYTILGLTNEAGEVAGKLKKVIRDAVGREAMIAELGDVLWYLAMAADELGVSLEEIAQHNLNKLRDRKERNVLGGSGDNR